MERLAAANRCYDSEDGPEHDAGQWTQQQNDRFLIALDAAGPAGNGRAEQRKKEHSHVLIVEHSHAEVMAQLVEEQHANQQHEA